MPKIVDRDARRELLLDVTWRIIEREGVRAVTLRRVAEECGMANGAVKPYFATKAQLLEAAFVLAYERTNARAASSIGALTGLEALRGLCLEIMPLDAARRTEARVVLAFWELAVADDGLAEVSRNHLEEWRARLERHLAEARAAGEIRDAVQDKVVIDQLLWLMMGLQAVVWIAPTQTAARSQRAALDALLESLA